MPGNTVCRGVWSGFFGAPACRVFLITLGVIKYSSLSAISPHKDDAMTARPEFAQASHGELER